MKPLFRSALLFALVFVPTLAAAQNGSLKITSFPTGAAVVIDGVNTGKVTPMSVSLSIGEHVVTVSIADAGWRPDTRTVTVAAGNNDLSVTLLPALTVGPKGDKGDPGPAGPQGPQGPPGPMYVPAAAPPVAYTGEFYVTVDGETIPLISFAGCYDALIGVEYEDCYFETAHLSRRLIQWFNETVVSGNARRDVVISFMPHGGNIFTTVHIGQGFLRELSFGDFNSNLSGMGRLRFIVVPTTLQTATGPTPPGLVNDRFYQHAYRLRVDNTDDARFITGVRGVRVTMEKLLSSTSGRRVFEPGQIQFDAFRIEADPDDLGDFDLWARGVANGTAAARNGSLELLDQAGKPAATILFTSLLPIAVEPFPTGTRRGIALGTSQFRLQVF